MRDYYSGINILIFDEDQILVKDKGILFDTYEECVKNLLYNDYLKHTRQHNFVVVNRHYNQSENKTGDKYSNNPDAYPEYGWIILVTRPDHTKEMIKSSQTFTNYNQAKKQMFQKITQLYEIASHSLKHEEYSSQHNICRMDYHVTLSYTVAG